jgi:hypothetical protein
MIGCPVCERSWSGDRQCHCAVCHEQFSTLSNFDKHMHDARSNYCHDPSERGLVLGGDNVWRLPPRVQG